MKNTKYLFGLLILFLFSCAQIKEITNTLQNAQRLQFKLESVNGFRLAGIGLSDKSSLSSFSLTDGLRLTEAFSKNSFPADFTLNVSVKNPNDGSKGTNKATAVISSLDWNLYVDDVLTVSGIINQPIEVPGSGQGTIIPLQVSLDLYKFFKDKGYDQIINLALALGGVNKSPARLKLDIKPTVNLKPFGSIAYPGRITVVDKEWR